MPTIDHKFLESPRDLAVLVDGIKFCRRVTKCVAAVLLVTHPAP